MKIYALCIVLLLLLGCTRNDAPALPDYQEIMGRDDAPNTGMILRRPVYRARVPASWVRQDPQPNQSIADTMLALVEFSVATPEGQVRVSVHNFPCDSLDERIAPAAQAARWRQQAGLDSGLTAQETPIARGGYAGLFLEADGLLAWAMQLSPEHFRSLQRTGSPTHQRYLRQLRADYTIKATGSTEAVHYAFQELTTFAHSFSLIQEIPTPL